MGIFKRVRSFLSGGLFFSENLARLVKVSNITYEENDPVSYRGMARSDKDLVAELYSSLNDGARLSWSRRWLYRFSGKKLMLLAVLQGEDGESIIGMNMYYLNKRDIAEGTIHEGFVGVSPKMAGHGIATNLRRIALKHFARNSFKGVSSRVSLDNKASLKSGEKLGYKPVEKYYDSAMSEERYYMICDLEQYK